MKIEIRESMAKTALCKNASGVKSRRLLLIWMNQYGKYVLLLFFFPLFIFSCWLYSSISATDFCVAKISVATNFFNIFYKITPLFCRSFEIDGKRASSVERAIFHGHISRHRNSFKASKCKCSRLRAILCPHCESHNRIYQNQDTQDIYLQLFLILELRNQ